MNYRKSLIVPAVLIPLLLAGCVSASKIQPIGPDRYIIKGRANGLNSGKENTKALKLAGAFCARQSKRVVLDNLVNNGHAAVLGEHVTLTFSCE